MSIQEIEREIATMPLAEARRLRQLIDARLRAGEAEEPAQPGGSVYERMKHLISNRDEPPMPDLSTNKEYLRDLGQSPLP